MRYLSLMLLPFLLVTLACGDSGTSGAGAAAGAGGLGGAGGSGAGAAGGGSSGCASCQDVVTLGEIQSSQVTEASGIAASSLHSKVFYVHNDSGDSARFFATDEKGADLGTYRVTNALANDWEDLARGPCANGADGCLYLGDIGDNNEERTSLTIYRVAEPATLSAGLHDITAESFSFTYPDGKFDSEALFVDQGTGTVYVMTKDVNVTRVYSLAAPLSAAVTMTAKYVGNVEIPDLVPLVTGADMSPNGQSVLVRTYSSVWRFDRQSGEELRDMFARPPCSAPFPTELQGEAIAFTTDGKGYRSVGEGSSPALHAVTCQ